MPQGGSPRPPQTKHRHAAACLTLNGGSSSPTRRLVVVGHAEHVVAGLAPLRFNVSVVMTSWFRSRLVSSSGRTRAARRGSGLRRADHSPSSSAL